MKRSAAAVEGTPTQQSCQTSSFLSMNLWCPGTIDETELVGIRSLPKLKHEGWSVEWLGPDMELLLKAREAP